MAHVSGKDEQSTEDEDAQTQNKQEEEESDASGTDTSYVEMTYDDLWSLLFVLENTKDCFISCRQDAQRRYFRWLDQTRLDHRHALNPYSEFIEEVLTTLTSFASQIESQQTELRRLQHKKLTEYKSQSLRNESSSAVGSQNEEVMNPGARLDMVVSLVNHWNGRPLAGGEYNVYRLIFEYCGEQEESDDEFAELLPWSLLQDEDDYMSIDSLEEYLYI